ncbi:MAG: hypothetical protein WA949_00865 [Phormidesmis sp.]
MRFLFFTGYRHSGALALTWQDIGKENIPFGKAVVYHGKAQVLKAGLKTQKSGNFPINRQMRELIEEIVSRRLLSVDVYRLVRQEP